MTLADFLNKCHELGTVNRCFNAEVRIGPVERKQHPHETHDIDDVVVKKDSFGKEYVEISEIPF